MRVRLGSRPVGRSAVTDEQPAQILLGVGRDVEVPEHQHLVFVEGVAQLLDRGVVEVGSRVTIRRPVAPKPGVISVMRRSVIGVLPSRRLRSR